jgi:hypothetical protein
MAEDQAMDDIVPEDDAAVSERDVGGQDTGSPEGSGSESAEAVSAPTDDTPPQSIATAEDAPSADASSADASSADADEDVGEGASPEAALADRIEPAGEAEEESDDSSESPAPPVVSAAPMESVAPVVRARGDDTRSLAARRPGGGSPGLAMALARSLWEEVVFPRARVKAALRRAEHHAKRYPMASAIAVALFVGLPFIMFMNAGFLPGILGWAVFVAAALFLIVGFPLLLIYAWPLTVVGVAMACVWVHLSMGEGALWLGVATISAMLTLYFAATEVVPFLAAGLVAWLVRDSGTAASVAAFCAASLFFIYYRYRMTGPLLYAGWVALSSALAARVACWSVGDALPLAWMRGPIMGPAGTTLWALAIASIAGLLVIPKKRRYRKAHRIKSIAEQLPP